MSLFGSIMDKIVGYAGSVLHPAAAVTSPATLSPATAEPTVAATPLQAVDVGAVLTALARDKGGALNWQNSIVDLLKLLDLDSSLAARKQLAEELDVHASADGTAEQNVALHQAVVRKLEENGGKVPASMKG